MTKTQMVVLDGYVLNPGDNPWDPVAALGELKIHDRTDPGQVLERARDARILMTNKTVVDAALLDGLPNLEFISVLATGYDVVDVAAARDRGIPVSNVPGYGTRAVAQFVMAQTLELCHGISAHDVSVREGRWGQGPDWCYWLRPQVELAGLTMGIVGFGGIGSRVAELAHAFGMRVLAHAPRPKPAPWFKPFGFASLEEIFEESDVISLHCPLTPDNEGFVNRALLSRMKPDALLINTARGALINEPDLAKALDQGLLGGAALDVLSSEPVKVDNPLMQAPRCILTPHIAWASQAARVRLMEQTAANITAFLAGTPVNVVNG
ncbi:D-2-hydroxyacid dehydrogenase [Desulfovibrio ferrophilus]|uniref:Glyoxylate reductase n=1 Tax=Desulfovibrio ferrophilus TaxID=241368 RepID=A0A2Z6B0T7_9BACT|nr:D-2-hydroxyacid dehydrogenase [Desulfovibrio ferrophilus]BBD09058.1 glyoxylate reductase [Desulfovibrio ferrophilus]